MIPVYGILPSFAGGGAERVALTLLQGLDRNQFDPKLLVFQASGPLLDLVPKDMAVTDFQRPRLRQAIMAVIKDLRHRPPGLVFSTLGYVSLALIAAKHLLPKGTKIIAREANMPSLSLSHVPAGGLLAMGYRLLARHADLQICTSQMMADEFKLDFSVPPDRLAVLANPVDVERLRGLVDQPVREPGTGRRFVAAGRLTYQKGFDRLLDIIADCPEDTHLTILGTGPDLTKLQAQAEKLSITQMVHFAGFVANPWAYFAGADAVLLPSRWEGMCNVALESLAMGTPVIATPESGGISELACDAPDGAVAVAAIGPEFLHHILAVSPQQKQAVSASFLPPSYGLEAVFAETNRLFSKLSGL